jgi:hypothetical protein
VLPWPVGFGAGGIRVRPLLEHHLPSIRQLLIQRHKAHEEKQIIGNVGPITARVSALDQPIALNSFVILVALCENSFFLGYRIGMNVLRHTLRLGINIASYVAE